MVRTRLGAGLAAALAGLQFLAGLSLGYALWGAQPPEVALASVRHVAPRAGTGLEARSVSSRRALAPAGRPLAGPAPNAREPETPSAAPLLTYCSLDRPGSRQAVGDTRRPWGSVVRPPGVGHLLRTSLAATGLGEEGFRDAVRAAAARRDPAALALALEAWWRKCAGERHEALRPCPPPR